ncbi:MAG TPA: membrane dipeptidase [Polyangiaceae bacterium]
MSNSVAGSLSNSVWAQQLGVSLRAVELVRSHPVIDLHVDSFIWTRLFGYDLLTRHDAGPLRARWFGQADLPRLRAAGVTGATWVITTNPSRNRRNRLRALVDNYRRLTSILDTSGSGARVVTNWPEYRAAREAGLHGAFVGLQGGNALSDPISTEIFPVERLLRVTLVHLSDSDLGTSSMPQPRGNQTNALSRRGGDLVSELESRLTLVDLAHASNSLFWDVVAMHDRARPLIVSHTGLSSVHPHWRNLDDQQLRAIANSGGVIGILYHGPFLGDGPFGGSVRSVARHIAHGLKVVGPSHICLGSDWDGLIATPFDMPTCLELPRLVEALLELGIDEDSIIRVLGTTFEQFLGRARP